MNRMHMLHLAMSVLLLTHTKAFNATDGLDRAAPIDRDEAALELLKPDWKSKAVDAMMAACSSGVAAAGISLCAQAMGVKNAFAAALGRTASAAGPAYVAAGLSMGGMALAIRSGRQAERANRMLRSLASEAAEITRSELPRQVDEQQVEVEAKLVKAGAEVKEALSELWNSMRRNEARRATSLDATSRRELLLLLRGLDGSHELANPSDEELERAEHYLLRNFPHKDTQSILLAAARAGRQLADLEVRTVANGNDEKGRLARLLM